MKLSLAQDVTNRDRMLTEARVTGLSFCEPEEYLKVMEAVNDVFEKGGAGAPSVKLDLTDGISMVGGEREAYLLLRRFLSGMKEGAHSSYDALIQEVGNQETALTTANEDFRTKVLGYPGKEGIFQRDALVDKFRTFIQQQNLDT